MRRYTLLVYNHTKERYIDNLSTLDAGQTRYFNVSWRLQGLGLKSESDFIYATIGERCIDLPTDTNVVVSWEDINDVVNIHQSICGKDILFLSIEVHEAADDKEWAQFLERIKPYICNTARCDIYCLGLDSREVDFTTRLFDCDNILKLFADIDEELREIESFLNDKDNDSSTLRAYKERFELLRYETCLQILCSNISDPSVVSKASGVVHTYSLTRQ